MRIANDCIKKRLIVGGLMACMNFRKTSGMKEWTITQSLLPWKYM
jgi:hypothetical protein